MPTQVHKTLSVVGRHYDLVEIPTQKGSVFVRADEVRQVRPNDGLSEGVRVLGSTVVITGEHGRAYYTDLTPEQVRDRVNEATTMVVESRYEPGTGHVGEERSKLQGYEPFFRPRTLDVTRVEGLPVPADKWELDVRPADVHGDPADPVPHPRTGPPTKLMPTKLMKLEDAEATAEYDPQDVTGLLGQLSPEQAERLLKGETVEVSVSLNSDDFRPTGAQVPPELRGPYPGPDELPTCANDLEPDEAAHAVADVVLCKTTMEKAIDDLKAGRYRPLVVEDEDAPVVTPEQVKGWAERRLAVSREGSGPVDTAVQTKPVVFYCLRCHETVTGLKCPVCGGGPDAVVKG